MDWCRAVVRLSLLAAWMICALPWLAARDRRGLSVWATIACRLLGVRIVCLGSAPRPGSLIVANHLGCLDVLAMIAHFDTTFVAKSEIARWPILGAVARRTGAIFITRHRLKDLPQVIGAMKAQLAAGRSVAYFPESTSTNGRIVLPFKSGLLQTAVDMQLPVTTVSLAADADRVCWYGEQSLLPHLWTLARMPATTLTLSVGTQPISDVNRKALASRVRQSVIEHRVCVPGRSTRPDGLEVTGGWRERPSEQ